VKALIIYDIHSNYGALLAVSHAEKAEEFWCLGDLVDFGPQPAETVCARRRKNRINLPV
jgi:hypothetical protein